jgi:hypothetical protein
VPQLCSLCAASYEFGLVSENRRKTLVVGTSTTYKFTGLSQGTSSLYVCVSDSYGAQACENADVLVAPPKCEFRLSDAGKQIDLQI